LQNEKPKQKNASDDRPMVFVALIPVTNTSLASMAAWIDSSSGEAKPMVDSRSMTAPPHRRAIGVCTGSISEIRIGKAEKQKERKGKKIEGRMLSFARGGLTGPISASSRCLD
jgi:hypothetical protein